MKDVYVCAKTALRSVIISAVILSLQTDLFCHNDVLKPSFVKDHCDTAVLCPYSKLNKEMLLYMRIFKGMLIGGKTKRCY